MRRPVLIADKRANFQFASNLLNQIRKIPGAVDFRIQEPNDGSKLNVTIDRPKASILCIAMPPLLNLDNLKRVWSIQDKSRVLSSP